MQLPKDVLNMVEQYQKWQQRNDMLFDHFYEDFLSYQRVGPVFYKRINNLFQYYELDSYFEYINEKLIPRVNKKDIFTDDFLLDLINTSLQVLINIRLKDLFYFNNTLRLSGSPLRIIIETIKKYGDTRYVIKSVF